MAELVVATVQHSTSPDAARRSNVLAQTRANWELMLRLHLSPAFGDVFVDAISKSDVEAWLGDEAKKVRAGSIRR